MSDLQEALQRVQAAANQDATGDATAHTNLLQEISNLRNAAETPADRLMRLRFHYIENLCVRVAIEYGVLQAIASKKGTPVTASQLATATGADELLIIRTMRLITHACIVDEIGTASYRGNATTELITSAGGIGGEKHHTDLTFAVGSRLISMIREKKFHMFDDGDGDTISPFEYTFNRPLFEHLQIDTEQKEAFDDYMSIRRSVAAPQWFETYPAKTELPLTKLKPGATEVLIIDVGGGAGHELRKFREEFKTSFPGRLVLQDLPETFRNHHSPDSLHDIEIMPHDFFTPQPVKGARIYFLRQILHDWSPAKCVQILRHIVQAMDPAYSRLLIDDYVLPDVGADRRSAALDFLMLMFVQGMERSRAQWEALLESVGLEIVRVWEGKTGLEGVIEAKVKGS